MQFTIDAVPGRTNTLNRGFGTHGFTWQRQHPLLSLDCATIPTRSTNMHTYTRRQIERGEPRKTKHQKTRRESPRHRGSVEDCETRHDGKPDTCGGSCKTQAPSRHRGVKWHKARTAVEAPPRHFKPWSKHRSRSLTAGLGWTGCDDKLGAVGIMGGESDLRIRLLGGIWRERCGAIVFSLLLLLSCSFGNI